MSDLKIVLVAPDGTFIELANHSGDCRVVSFSLM
jgi:hypothetical protein